MQPTLRASIFPALLATLLTHLPCQAQLVIHQNQVPDTLVRNVLLGPDVTVSNVLFNGTEGNFMAPSPTWLGGIGRFNGINSNVGLDRGIFLCTNEATHHLPGPNDELMENGGGVGSAGFWNSPEPDLSLLTGDLLAIQNGGSNIRNKAVLEFDLVPANDMISFRFVFSSEEYERWACSQYNDVFGMFISGPGIPTDINGPFSNNAMNIAFIPGSLSPVSINTVNSGATTANMNGPWNSMDPWEYCRDADPNWQANTPYYRYNGGQWQFIGATYGPQLEAPYNNDPYYIQHNGLTVVLTASAAVQIGATYHLKMAIGNVKDNDYPSAVFLERNSLKASDRFSTTVEEGPNVDLTGDTIVLYESNTDSVHLRFNRWGGFYLGEELSLVVEGDAVAGQDYFPALPTSFHLAQLDSAFEVALAVPVTSGATRHLTINLVSDSGAVVRTYPFRIERVSGMGAGEATISQLGVFPNPAEDVLHVTFPIGMNGRAELQVLDASGRVVRQRVLSATTRTTIDLGGLPNGLYTVKALVGGTMATARVSVRR